MSRTYRKSNITESKSKVEFVNERLDSEKCRYQRKLVWSDNSEFNYQQALKEHSKALEIFSHSLQPSYKFPRRPSRYSYYDIKRIPVSCNENKVRCESESEYDRFKRDGKCSETGRKSAFRAHAARDLRRMNKRLLNKIKKGEDYDNEMFPDIYLGKKLIWDYW